MQLNLVAHPDFPAASPSFRLWVNVDYAGSVGATATANLWFGVSARLDRFTLRPPAEGFVDGLWESTCFEAFLKPAGESSYHEWNFAPSGEWAAYGFSGRREGMERLDVAHPPYIRVEDNLIWWALGATISVEAERAWELGLSAVVEEVDGTKSYWALAHPSGPPDFHHPDCFAARLA